MALKQLYIVVLERLKRTAKYAKSTKEKKSEWVEPEAYFRVFRAFCG